MCVRRSRADQRTSGMHPQSIGFQSTHDTSCSRTRERSTIFRRRGRRTTWGLDPLSLPVPSIGRPTICRWYFAAPHPQHSTSANPEVTVASDTAPDRWRQSEAAVLILTSAPQRRARRYKIQLDNPAATTRTEEPNLPVEAVFACQVNHSGFEFLRQVRHDACCEVRWCVAAEQPPERIAQRAKGSQHCVACSLSCGTPISGSQSPKPAYFADAGIGARSSSW